MPHWRSILKTGAGRVAAIIAHSRRLPHGRGAQEVQVREGGVGRAVVWTLAGAALLAVALAGAPAAAQWDDSERYRWNLADLYPSVDAWRSERDSLRLKLRDLQKCLDKNLKRGSTLAECMRLSSEIAKRVVRLYSYASMGKDAGGEGAAIELYGELESEAEALYGEIQAALSSLEPKVRELGARRVLRAAEREEELQPFDHYFANLFRRVKDGRVLGEEAERAMALADPALSAFQSVHGDFFNREMEWPRVVSPENQEIELNSQGYVRARAHGDRSFRELAFARFYNAMADKQSTLGGLLAGAIKANIARARSRHYDRVGKERVNDGQTALRARLDSDNLPPKVYTTLVEQTRASVGALHRYFLFRARMLGLPKMAYYDIYPSLVPSLDRRFPIDQGVALMREALRPLGPDYAKLLESGLAGRWMDVFPRPGKRSGAYMNGGAYDVHPYILLNYQERFDDVSTLAHEWGHAVHSLLAQSSQPFEKADYSTFLAEIASILPETLMIDHLIANAGSAEEKLFYLTQAMEQIRGTYYRQTMFSEFEQRAYAHVEQGRAATGSEFSKIYRDVVRTYHGHQQGIVQVPEYIDLEWAYIPHFYLNFYVYNYATSMAAALYMAEGIQKGTEGAVENFLKMLRAGGSDYPHEILLASGVDMREPAVYRAVGQRMHRLLDEAEMALNVMEGRPPQAGLRLRVPLPEPTADAGNTENAEPDRGDELIFPLEETNE